MTIVLDFVVQDANGRPVTDLTLAEVEVVQDATRQRVTVFEALAKPGHYHLSYVPESGKAGGVTVHVLRARTRVRGPAGPVLQPRVVRRLSSLETELTRLLDARPDADDIRCAVSVLRFEAAPEGTRHTVAVELPLSELRLKEEQGRYAGRLQILSRIRAADSRFQRLLTEDLPIEAGSGLGYAGRSLVWTASISLPPGRYSVDTVVREVGSERASVRKSAVDVVAAPAGLRISSVVLLQPKETFFSRDTSQGDPFVSQGTPMMPRLDAKVTLGYDEAVRFFVVLYPDARRPEPVTMHAELHRDDVLIGEVPITLSAAEPSGEIRYIGRVSTKTFRSATYRLRLVGRQGDAEAAAETSFVASSPERAPVRPSKLP